MIPIKNLEKQAQSDRAVGQLPRILEKRSGGFHLTQLAQNRALCEATIDRHRWNNATQTEPAFLVYLGCNTNEVPMWIEKLNNFYHCHWIEVRKPKHLKEFEAELKIRGMRRCSDMDSLGLDQKIKS